MQHITPKRVLVSLHVQTWDYSEQYRRRLLNISGPWVTPLYSNDARNLDELKLLVRGRCDGNKARAHMPESNQTGTEEFHLRIQGLSQHLVKDWMQRSFAHLSKPFLNLQ